MLLAAADGDHHHVVAAVNSLLAAETGSIMQRLRDAGVYSRAYGHPHTAPELLGEAVYGITEHARERVRAARLVANPGCYPTATLLALLPLTLASFILSQSKLARTVAVFALGLSMRLHMRR